ncbi:MAG: glycosyltransferase family 2 protein [Fibrobacter sp.]|nr:glycosyltransferase family 2 protein [Fibrobacter sp.]
MKERRIDIGIINYNGGDHLIGCIESLQNMRGCAVTIYVLDNASSDGSMERARSAFPGHVYLDSPVNLGYAGGINLLLASMTAPIVAFCNMDLEFSPDWAGHIIDCFDSDPDAASVASLVIEKESGSVYSSAVNFFWDLFPVSSRCTPDTDQPYEVASAYGAVMTFRRELFDRIGRFDHDYFLFFEETEFYLRMHLNSEKTILCPCARVYHHRSLSTIRFSGTKLFYSERNRVMTAFKYLPWWYLPLIFPLSALRFGIMASGGIPKADGSGKKISGVATVMVILRAWLSAFRFLPREWAKRSRVRINSKQSASMLRFIAMNRLRLRDLTMQR